MGESPTPAGRMKRRTLLIFVGVLVPCVIAANQAGMWLADRMYGPGLDEVGPYGLNGESEKNVAVALLGWSSVPY